MDTPFGTALLTRDGRAHEALEAPFAAALAAAATQPWPLPDTTSDDTARVVAYTFTSEGVDYGADLADTQPLTARNLPRADALTALARVGRALTVLRERGAVHGDLRPELVRVAATGRAVVVAPSHASAAGAVLRARLHPGGVAPSAVAWAAPEVVAGAEVTASSDVYGLAAVVYATLTGYAPHGQIALQGFSPTPQGDLARCVTACLAMTPTERPPLEMLVAQLERAANHARSAPSADGTPYRDAPRAPADGAAPPRTESSPVLVLTLVVGAIITFLGAVMLVTVGWSVVGSFGRVMLLAGMAAASWGAGSLAAKHRIELAVVVARAVAGIFAVVALAYSFSQLDDPGRLALLTALTAASFVGGTFSARRGAPTAGAALHGLGSQLVWTVGAQVIHMSPTLTGSGPIAALGAVVSALTVGLALWRRSALFATVAALDAAVFAVALGDHLHTGAEMGPSVYALVVSAGYAGLTALAARGDAKDGTPLPFAWGAGLAAAFSVLTALFVVDRYNVEHLLLAAAWPYVVAALAAMMLRANDPLRGVAVWVLACTLTVAPTAEALARDDFTFTVVAAGVGLAVVLAAVYARPLRRDDDAWAVALLVGLASALVAPGWRLLQMVLSTYDSGGGASRWGLVAATGAALVALSYANTTRVGRANRRLLECAGVLPLLGALTLRTMAAHREALPVLGAFALSGVATAAGLTTRRAALLVCGALGIFVNVWVQYFARLETLPLSVRLVGFGVALLALGVLYEQRIRHRIPLLRDWN